MKFSTLPWFIRKEIIDYVTRYTPKYSLLSKEWLIKTAKEYGEIVVNFLRPEEDPRNLPHAIYFGKIRFNRFWGIDWDTIYSSKLLHCAMLNFQPLNSKAECEELISKLLELPHLKSLKVNIGYEHPNFNLSRFLVSQNKIEELSITTVSLKACLNSRIILFPSLINLKVTQLEYSFDMNMLLKIAPKLKKLTLNYLEGDSLVHFDDQTIPNITELNIDHFWRDGKVRLNLSTWSNIKKLYTTSPIEFYDMNHFTNITDLSLVGSCDYVSNVVSANFINLRRLSVSIQDTLSIELIDNTMKLCTSITKLKLFCNEFFDLTESLRAGPYTVTDLNLAGCTINSNFLRWLSDSFNLVKLELLCCHLEEGISLETVPFTTLNFLKIKTGHDDDNYRGLKKYFNQTLYPHIKRIIIRRAR